MKNLVQHPLITTATLLAGFMFVITGMLGYIKLVAVPAALVLSQPGFTTSYFNNRYLSKTPAVVRNEQAINLTLAPQGINTEVFSVRWAGNMNVTEAGTYTFTVEADDGVRMWIDSKLVLNKWYRNNATYTFDKTLAKGSHFIKVEYFQQYGTYKAKVNWTLKAASESTPPVIKNPPTKPTTSSKPSTSSTNTTKLDKPTVVVFITGGGDVTNLAALQNLITATYKAKLPAGTPWLIMGYDQDVTAAISQKYPNRQVILLGHSFGGEKAIHVAQELDQPIELLMTFDAVHSGKYGGAYNQAENFTIPNNVKKAVAYRRYNYSSVPASGWIANPRSQDTNISYGANNAIPAEDLHGWAVWNLDFSYIKNAL
jgi:hypothetical protein